jgi:hypothetical protein
VVLQTLSWKIPSQKRASGVAWGVGPEFKPQYQKNKKRKKQASRVFQVAECLWSKCEALSSNPRTNNNNKKNF